MVSFERLSCREKQRLQFNLTKDRRTEAESLKRLAKVLLLFRFLCGVRHVFLFNSGVAGKIAGIALVLQYSFCFVLPLKLIAESALVLYINGD